MLANAQRHRTKGAMVYDALRLSIMRCELRPGHRLIIDEISRQLGVSQIPVREALQQLQSERLVVTVPHIGATVASLSPADVTEVFVLMEALETVAVEAVARRIDDDLLVRIESLVAAMDLAVAQDDGETWASRNSELHRLIAAEAGMPMLNDMTNRTLDHWDRVRRYFGILSDRLDRAQRQHHELLDAFRVRDVDRLKTVIRQHNREPLEAYTAQLASEQVVVGMSIAAGEGN